MTPNETKLALLKAKLEGNKLRKKEVIEAARVVANEMIKHIQIPEVQLSAEMKESLVQLALTLGALNKRFGDIEESHQKTITTVESAINDLSTKMSDKVVAQLTDEQIAALSQSVATSVADLKIVNKITVSPPKVINQSKKSSLAETITIPGLIPAIEKIADKVPSTITGTVKLADYNTKDDPKKYLAIRITDGVKFIDPSSNPGAGGRIIPGGGGTPGGGGGDASAANQVILIDSVDALGSILAGSAATQDDILDAVDTLETLMATSESLLQDIKTNTASSAGKPSALYGFSGSKSDSGHNYFLYERADGAWYVAREVIATGIFDYATIVNNGTVATLADAITAIAGVGLTYNNYATAF